MANYPQELAQDAVCRSHDWALVPAKSGLQGWILMNEWMNEWIYIYIYSPKQTGHGVTGDLYPGIKRPVREADHSPLYSAEFNQNWWYTSTPQMPLWHAQKHYLQFHSQCNYCQPRAETYLVCGCSLVRTIARWQKVRSNGGEITNSVKTEHTRIEKRAAVLLSLRRISYKVSRQWTSDSTVRSRRLNASARPSDIFLHPSLVLGFKFK